MKLIIVTVKNGSTTPVAFTTWDKAQNHADELFKLFGGTKPFWNNKEDLRIGKNNLIEITLSYMKIDYGLKDGKWQFYD